MLLTKKALFICTARHDSKRKAKASGPILLDPTRVDTSLRGSRIEKNSSRSRKASYRARSPAAPRSTSLSLPSPSPALTLPRSRIGAHFHTAPSHCTDGRQRRRPGRNGAGARRREAREGPRGRRLRRQPPLPQALPHRGPSPSHSLLRAHSWLRGKVFLD